MLPIVCVVGSVQCGKDDFSGKLIPELTQEVTGWDVSNTAPMASRWTMKAKIPIAFDRPALKPLRLYPPTGWQPSAGLPRNTVSTQIGATMTFMMTLMGLILFHIDQCLYL